MTSQDRVLDETQWFSPDHVRQFGGIHENTGQYQYRPGSVSFHADCYNLVLFYFAQSPFFEATSNNSSIYTQAMYNPSMLPLLSTRDTFEAHLKTLQGLEYLVAFGPKDFGPEAHIGRGTWVIRKQNRRKRPGGEDEVTILATYFVIGERIYMAPSVSNIMQARLVSELAPLHKLF